MNERIRPVATTLFALGQRRTIFPISVFFFDRIRLTVKKGSSRIHGSGGTLIETDGIARNTGNARSFLVFARRIFDRCC